MSAQGTLSPEEALTLARLEGALDRIDVLHELSLFVQTVGPLHTLGLVMRVLAHPPTAIDERLQPLFAHALASAPRGQWPSAIRTELPFGQELLQPRRVEGAQMTMVAQVGRLLSALGTVDARQAQMEGAEGIWI